MKRLLIVSLAVLCAAALLPQTLSAGIGIKGGYALSKFTTAPVGGIFSNLPSPVGGIFFSLGLGPLAIQPEVLYVRMGGKIEILEDSLEERLEYIQVPVLLKLNVIPAGPLRPFIYAGGYGAYLLKANEVTSIDGATDKLDVTENYEKYDYGVIGGAGLTFKLPGISVSVEGRYNYGLKNIKALPGEGESIKNRSMMVLVGLGF